MSAQTRTLIAYVDACRAQSEAVSRLLAAAQDALVFDGCTVADHEHLVPTLPMLAAADGQLRGLVTTLEAVAQRISSRCYLNGELLKAPSDSEV